MRGRAHVMCSRSSQNPRAAGAAAPAQGGPPRAPAAAGGHEVQYSNSPERIYRTPALRGKTVG